MYFISWNKREQTKQARAKQGGMPACLVITNNLAVLYEAQWYLHILVLQCDLQTFLVDLPINYMATVMFTNSYYETQNHLCCHFLEQTSCLKHTYTLHSKHSGKSCFLLEKIQFSSRVFYYTISTVSVWHLPFPKTMRNFSTQFLGRKQWHSGARKIIP